MDLTSTSSGHFAKIQGLDLVDLEVTPMAIPRFKPSIYSGISIYSMVRPPYIQLFNKKNMLNMFDGVHPIQLFN